MADTYCVSERRYTGNIDPKVHKTKKGSYVIKSTCPSCGNKKSRFIKRQDASGIFSKMVPIFDALL